MTQEYSAKKIKVLEGLEAVRKRPAMYIGSTDISGIHHLIYEVVDNAVDEALAGYCTEVKLVIGEDNAVTVTDNGRGIPVGMHPTENKPAVEVVFNGANLDDLEDYRPGLKAAAEHSVLSPLAIVLLLEWSQMARCLYPRARAAAAS